MTDNENDSAAADRHSDDCAQCPMAPNAIVAVPLFGAGVDRRTFLTRAMMSAALLALAPVVPVTV